MEKEIEKRKEKLPALSEEYNRKYYVENKAEIGKLLVKSDYTILHRPYFAMKGSTHDVITVNPHTKVAIDAAPIAEQPMTPQEFLKLFSI